MPSDKPKSTLARLGKRSPGFYESEPPTVPKGLEFEAALLVRYYKECAKEDRACLLKNAEGWAARNRK